MISLAGSLRSLAFLPLAVVDGRADDGCMFSVYCEAHGSEVLLSARNLEAIDNDEHGLVAHWRCTCGHRGTFRSGRARRPATA